MTTDRDGHPGRARFAVAALLTGLAGALVTLAAGFALALLYPDGALIAMGGRVAGTANEALDWVPQLLAARTGSGPAGVRAAPVLFVLVPLGGTAIPAFLLSRSAAGGRPLGPAWALGAGLVLALLTLAMRQLGDDGGSDAPVAEVLGLALLWGSLGALAGASAGSRRSRAGSRRADRRGGVAAVVRACLGPLAVVLAIASVLGLGGWLILTARGVADTEAGRSTPVAVVENGLYVVEHGVHLTELAAFVRFETQGFGAIALPFPVEDVDAVISGETYDILAYRDALPDSVFLPALILLVALVGAGALAAGARVARARSARSPVAAALWGVVVGPAWALALLLLDALARKEVVFGDPSAESVLVSFLVGGAVLGALGGLLAGLRPAAPAST